MLQVDHFFTYIVMTNRTGTFGQAGLLLSAFAAPYNTLYCSASSAVFWRKWSGRRAGTFSPWAWNALVAFGDRLCGGVGCWTACPQRHKCLKGMPYVRLNFSVKKITAWLRYSLITKKLFIEPWPHGTFSGVFRRDVDVVVGSVAVWYQLKKFQEVAHKLYTIQYCMKLTIKWLSNIYIQQLTTSHTIPGSHTSS